MPFVGYPSAFLFPRPSKMSNRSSIDHYPWGYFVSTTGETKNGFLKIRKRWKDKQGNKKTHAWIREEQVQSSRILEVNFVDIGQGDGCFVVFPDDQRMLIDAGESDNMYRFLRWRFNRKTTHVQNVVITHPDQDHYLGFKAVINDPKFSFGNVYHNGIVERAGPNSLGPKSGRKLTDIIETPEQLNKILDKPSLVGRKRYPNLLKTMRDSNRVDFIWMLHTGDGFMPGFEADKAVSLQVLGPMPQQGSGGRLQLPTFGSKGKTKNGHSVVLRLRYGNVSMLLGGDLNIPAEHYLLEQHTGLDPTPRTVAELEALVSAARRTFRCDLMKACHHGSADFSETFLDAVNPAATVISSGDQESHCHPRPDTLGTIGKHSRGRRPLIFSTELARSTREFVETPAAIFTQIDVQEKIRDATTSTTAEKNAAKKKIRELMARRERAVAVYGMVTARTDGTNMILTQKLEAKRGSTGEKWDIHRFEPAADGTLHYQSKH